MKLKSLVIYAVIFCLVGGFYYFYEVRYQTRQNELKEAQTRIFNLEMDKVKGFDLRLDGEDIGLVRDKPDKWRIVSPVETPADRWEVEGLLRQALEGKKDRVFADPVENLEDYGLKDPAVSLTLKGADGKPAAPTLYVGDDNPNGSSRYAKLGDSKEVFTVNASFHYGLDKSLFDLREKSLVLTPGEKVDSVVLSGDPEVELKKGGIRHWDIVTPVPGKADDDQVQRLVFQGLKGRVNEFVPKADPDKDYGLDNPRADIKVFSEGKIVAEITVGQEEKSVSKDDVTKEEVKGVWVKSTQRPELMLVPEKVVSILMIGYNDLKDRHVVDLDRRTLDSLEIKSGDKMLKAEKKDNGWIVAQPADSASSDGDLEEFLMVIEDLKYTRRLDSKVETVGQYGLNQPDLTVVMSGPQGAGAMLALSLKPVDEKYLAVRVGDGPVSLVEKDEILSSIPKEFKPPQNTDIDPQEEVKK